MNLSGIDLNLLLVFDAVMRERNVTRAGALIGMSQPAVSNALTRLRHHLKDELFIRSPEGMKATPRALELAEPIRSALHHLEEALDPATFDPSTDRRAFRIVAIDYAVAVMMPILFAHLAQVAPGIDLRLLPDNRTDEKLDAHEADFALIVNPDPPERFEHITLGSDTFVLMMRGDHPLAKGKLSLEKFAAANHLLVSNRGDPHGFVDDVLASKGLTRRVSMTVPQFSVTPQILASSDMVLTVPKGLADLYAPAYGLIQRDAPIQGPPELRQMQLVWHRRLANHPAHRWLLDQMLSILAGARAAA